jgi:hypothetical protein
VFLEDCVIDLGRIPAPTCFIRRSVGDALIALERWADQTVGMSCAGSSDAGSGPRANQSLITLNPAAHCSPLAVPQASGLERLAYPVSQ